AAALGRDVPGVPAGQDGDGFEEFRAGVEQAGAVFGRVPGGQRSVRDKFPEHGPARLVVKVVVDAVAVGEESETAGERVEVVPVGVGGPADVPAEAAALQPASTTPASQHSRRISGRPCACHTATRLTTLPPQTRSTSCASRCARTSGTFSWVNNRRELKSTSSRPANRPAKWSMASCRSPTAVGMRHSLLTGSFAVA